jgi:hypothetical protein
VEPFTSGVAAAALQPSNEPTTETVLAELAAYVNWIDGDEQPPPSPPAPPSPLVGGVYGTMPVQLMVMMAFSPPKPSDAVWTFVGSET